MAPRREEAGAVQGMRDLYSWDEILSGGFQFEGLDEAIKDWECVNGRMPSGAGTDAEAMFGEAATACGWVTMRLCLLLREF